MRILFINTLDSKEKGGGVEHFTWDLMCALKDKGYQCILLSTKNNASEPDLSFYERNGIKVYCAGIRNFYWPHQKKRRSLHLKFLWHFCDIYNPLMENYIFDVVFKEKPDIAILQNLSGWSASSWNALKRLQIPVIQVLHDYYLICPKCTMRNKEKNCTYQCLQCKIFRMPHIQLSQSVTAVVGVSRYILNTHLRLGYFKDVPINRVIHNFRNPTSLGVCNEKEESLFRCDRNLILGFIGRLDPVKGVPRLIYAVKDLVTINPNIKLLIAGDGEASYVNFLKNIIGENQNIMLIGKVDQHEFYPYIDVLVVPSLWNEPQGIVVIEAFAYGKPVIAANKGGIPEMIQDGYNGFLIDTDDCENHQLKDKIKKMLSPKTLETMQNNAIKSFQTFGSWNTFVAKYENIISEVGNKHRKGYDETY